MKTIKNLEISAPLDADGTREISVRRGGVRHVAYGRVADDGETHSVEHAPTVRDYIAVAYALDVASPAQIRRAFAR